MNVGDIVVDKPALGTIVGKTTDGKWVVEWSDGELHPYDEESLFLVESKNDGIPSKN